jgi:branched-chain amino acid transport system substrate-binding protein
MRNTRRAEEVVERFKKQGFDPEGYTLYTYAAFQVFAAAAEKSKSLKLADLTKALRDGSVPTVVGDLTFDAKGDVKQPAFTFFVWKDGKSAQMQ